MGYRPNLPPIPPITPDASRAERQAAFEAYRAELHALNPWAFHKDGDRQPWWQVLVAMFRWRRG